MRSLALLLVVLSLGLFAVGCGGPADPPDSGADPVVIEPADMSMDEEVVVEEAVVEEPAVEEVEEAVAEEPVVEEVEETVVEEAAPEAPAP